MKLFIILAAVAVCNAAKLDNTYLPPSHSQSSGGSPFLQAPFGDQGQANGFPGNGDSFAQGGGDFAQNGNGFGQNGDALNANEYAQTGAEFNNFNNNNFGSESRPERPQAAFERTASILRQDNQNDGETYSYAFETENGIYAEENGVATNGVEAQGGYSYTGDDGQVYSVRYTADQNGFVPQGDHLPTPPPVPEEILKALEQNARDEAAGIYDDGMYSEGKYSNSEDQYNNNNNANFANNDFNNGNAFNQNQFESEGDDDSVVTTNALFRQSGANGANGAAEGATSQAYLPPTRGSNGIASQDNFRGASTQGATSQAYLPPTASQRGSNGPANQASFNNQAATSQAYLPPTAGQRGSSGANQVNRGASNQGATNQAYLPPFAGQRGSNGAASQDNFRGASNQAATNQAYLPPFAGQRSSNAGPANQPSFNSGSSNQGSFEQANKAYLPPLAAQRTTGAVFGSRVRPSFSARNGYRY